MSFYSDIQSDVVAEFQIYGAEVTLKSLVAGTYDPATGVTTSGTYLLVETFAVLKDYQEGAIDGTIIKMGDRKALLPGSIRIAPKPGDQLVLPDGTWTVPQDSPGAVLSVSPGGVPLIYTVRIRK
jgi:hypothetical protein